VLAEVPAAPLVPVGALYAAGLLALCGYLLAVGMRKGYAETLGAFIRWLAHQAAYTIHVWRLSFKPIGWLEKPLLTVDKQIRNAFSSLELRAEHAASWCFSTAGIILDWTGREIAGLAHDVLGFGRRVVVAEIPKSVRAAEKSALARLRGIDQLIDRLEAQVKAALKRLQVGIDRVTHIATKTIPHALSGVAGRVGALERQGKRTVGRLNRVERLLTGAAFAALVWTALSRLGLRWLRCGNVRKAGKAICGMSPSTLEALLADAFELGVVLDLCRFALAAQKFAKILVPQLGVMLLVQDAVCLGGGASLPSAADSPRTRTRITLPSAHD
jgi:hypothetical protein